MQIRDLNPCSPSEIAQVAQRMQDTLVEVEGGERGRELHSLAWLEQRLRWHLDPSQTLARVQVAFDDEGRMLGHHIARIEGPPAPAAEGSSSAGFGLLVTTFILPEARRRGLAGRFLRDAEAWFLAQGVPLCGTWTSATNTPLITLHKRHGYQEVDHGPNGINGTPMVKLGKRLGGQASA